MRTTSTGKQKRSFTVSDAKHTDGCSTKFTSKGYTGSYTGSNPAQAAKKAFTQLCRVKKVRGACTLYVTVRETTQEASDKKNFTYRLTRSKLAKPIKIGDYEVKYETSVKSAKKAPGCKKSRKSSGRKVSRTRKGKKHLK